MSRPGHNFVLLQWLVVDGFQQCNLKLFSRQTLLSSPDSPPLQVTHVRYTQGNNENNNLCKYDETSEFLTILL